jgi:hypothetical protein
MGWATDTTKKFVNPYNFIPLGKGKRREERGGDLLTGRIECTLTLKTGLFIPNTSSEDAFGLQTTGEAHKSYEFFSYIDLNEGRSESDGKPKNPVIPGSELRGVIRAEYEALTDSCLSMDYDADLYARSRNYKKPGIVVGWSGKKPVLYAADKIRLPQHLVTSHRLQTGDIVKFRMVGKSILYSAVKIQDVNSGLIPETTLGHGDVAVGAVFLNGERLDISVGENKIRLPQHLVTSHDLKTGDVVRFRMTKRVLIYEVGAIITDVNADLTLKLNERTQLEDGCAAVGVVLLGEDFGGKNAAHIFVPTGGLVDSGDEIKDALERLKKTLESYRNPKINQNHTENGGAHEGYAGYAVSVGELLPVWYEQAGSAYFLSPACRGKDYSRNTLKYLLKNSTRNVNGTPYLPCDSAADMCPACSLFGTVFTAQNKKDGNAPQASAAASRLRFTDARFAGAGAPSYADKKTLQELAEPKRNCAEFYTHFELDDGNYRDYRWNFDFCTDAKRINISLDGKLKLNGRKFYLHHAPQYNRDEPKTIRNCTVRPLSAGENNKFSFQVFFDRISETELKRLLVILSGGKNAGGICHKIGKGKPLGLGSVKIKVSKVFFRDIRAYLTGGGPADVSEEYKAYYTADTPDTAGYFEDGRDEDIFQAATEVISAYRKLMSFESFNNTTVSYPIGEDTTESDMEKRNASYQWFAGARERVGRGARVSLPLASEHCNHAERVVPLYKMKKT